MNTSGDSADERFAFDAPGSFDFAAPETYDEVDDGYFDPDRVSDPGLSRSYIQSEENLGFLRQFSDETADIFAQHLAAGERESDEGDEEDGDEEEFGEATAAGLNSSDVVSASNVREETNDALDAEPLEPVPAATAGVPAPIDTLQSDVEKDASFVESPIAVQTEAANGFEPADVVAVALGESVSDVPLLSPTLVLDDTIPDEPARIVFEEAAEEKKDEVFVPEEPAAKPTVPKISPLIKKTAMRVPLAKPAPGSAMAKSGKRVETESMAAVMAGEDGKKSKEMGAKKGEATAEDGKKMTAGAGMGMTTTTTTVSRPPLMASSARRVPVTPASAAVPAPSSAHPPSATSPRPASSPRPFAPKRAASTPRTTTMTTTVATTAAPAPTPMTSRSRPATTATPATGLTTTQSLASSAMRLPKTAPPARPQTPSVERPKAAGEEAKATMAAASVTVRAASRGPPRSPRPMTATKTGAVMATTTTTAKTPMDAVATAETKTGVVMTQARVPRAASAIGGRTASATTTTTTTKTTTVAKATVPATATTTATTAAIAATPAPSAKTRAVSAARIPVTRVVSAAPKPEKETTVGSSSTSSASSSVPRFMAPTAAAAMRAASVRRSATAGDHDDVENGVPAPSAAPAATSSSSSSTTSSTTTSTSVAAGAPAEGFGVKLTVPKSPRFHSRPRKESEPRLSSTTRELLRVQAEREAWAKLREENRRTMENARLLETMGASDGKGKTVLHEGEKGEVVEMTTSGAASVGASTSATPAPAASTLARVPRVHRSVSAAPRAVVAPPPLPSTDSESMKASAAAASASSSTMTTATASRMLKPTEPKPFKLHVDERSRARTGADATAAILSTEERELLAMRAQQFHARPFDPRIKFSTGEVGVARVPKKPLTEPKTPDLATFKRSASVASTDASKVEKSAVGSEMVAAVAATTTAAGSTTMIAGGASTETSEAAREVIGFHARPMPRFDAPPAVPARSASVLTTPMSPILHTKARAAVRPPVVGVEAATATAATASTDHPLGPTIPAPFALETEARHARHAMEEEARRRQEEAALQAHREFHARPAPTHVLHGDGFRPKHSEKPVTTHVTVVLHSDARAEERARFDHELERRLAEQAAEKKREEEERMRREQEEVERLRRTELVFKARPVPSATMRMGGGGVGGGMKHAVKVTVPKSPELHTAARAMATERTGI